jgi:type II secretory pathway component PulF
MIAPQPPAGQETNDEPVYEADDVLAPVARLAAAELPLASGLAAYSREVPSWRMRLALRRMSRDIDGGKTLDEVLDRQSWRMPAYLRGLIRAGVRTGRLGQVMEEHLLCVRRTRAARTRLWLALLYPIVLLCLTFAVLGLLLTWPVPMFKSVFEDFGIQLPEVTIFMLQISDAAVWLLEHLAWVLSPLAVIGAVLAALWLLPGRGLRTWFFQLIPIIGTASSYVGLSEFCSLLAILVDNRVPLPEALRLTASGLTDANLRDGSRRLAERIEQGQSMVDAARGLLHFPRTVMSIFRWQSNPKALADGLRSAGELFAVQARVQSNIVGVFIQPLLLVFVVVLIGLFVIGMFMPLIKLLNELS